MLTFKCNRGGEDFKSILRENGFKEVENNEPVDFSYWDTYYGEKVDSKIMLNDLKLTKNIDNKEYLYKIIEKLKLTHHVPKTFLNISNLTNDELDNNKLYFLKLIYGSGGKDVHPIKSIKDIDKILKGKQDENKNVNYYLIQEEVPNMYLHQGKYKTSMRNYVLVCDDGLYFYKDGYIYLYNKEYDKNNLDNSIHNDVFNVKYEKLSDQYYYDKILPQLINICSELLIPYFKDISFNNQYYILGLDFIIDKDYKPYLIEINQTPNINITDGESYIKKNMLNDFIKFYVLPKLTDKELEIGGWLKIE